MKWNSTFNFSEPHAAFYHHFFQMVDILTQHCRRAMHELNPCALPYALQYQDANTMNGDTEENTQNDHKVSNPNNKCDPEQIEDKKGRKQEYQHQNNTYSTYNRHDELRNIIEEIEENEEQSVPSANTVRNDAEHRVDENNVDEANDEESIDEIINRICRNI